MINSKNVRFCSLNLLEMHFPKFNLHQKLKFNKFYKQSFRNQTDSTFNSSNFDQNQTQPQNFKNFNDQQTQNQSTSNFYNASNNQNSPQRQSFMNNNTNKLFSNNKQSSNNGGSFFGEGFDMKLNPISDQSQMNLTPFKKNFYTPHENILNMSKESVELFYQQNNMTVNWFDESLAIDTSQPIPNPVTEIHECNFSPQILSTLRNNNITKPTPIQSQGWPIALSGIDLIGVSATGSGKTLSFLLPAFLHVNAQDPLTFFDGPIALVLSPTRELSIQSQQQCYLYQNGVQRMDNAKRIQSFAVYGGSPKASQISRLRKGVEILFATPGRLLDLLQCGATNLKRVTYLVIDEADMMLDMGFEPQLKQIMGQIRPDRQCTMQSATQPKEVKNIASKYTTNPIKINVGSQRLSANQMVEQIVEVIVDRQQIENSFIRDLTDELKKVDSKILVFFNSKLHCDKVTRAMRSNGINAYSLHGDKSQSERAYVMNMFRTSSARVLCATDVASRGLDISNVTLVINFDFPSNVESYIHRIGRTGRAGNYGRAISYLTPNHYHLSKEVIEIMRDANQKVPDKLLELEQSLKERSYQRKSSQRSSRNMRRRNSNTFTSGANSMKLGDTFD